MILPTSARRLLCPLLSGLLAVLLASCSTEPDEITSSKMCYTVQGDTMAVQCLTDAYDTCLENDASTLGSYDNYNACAADTDAVLENWKYNGNVAAGPNAAESTGGGGTDSSSGGGTGAGGNGTYPYTFTCSMTGESQTVDVPANSCSSETEYFGEVFGCNLIDEMGQACRLYYGCLGADTTACAAYDR